MLQSDSEVSEKTKHLHSSKPDPSSLNSQIYMENIKKIANEKANNDPSCKNIDVVKLLAQEALEYKRRRLLGYTRDHSSLLKDNTHSANVTIRSRRFGKREFNWKPTLESDFTTTDDSNTAFVENTQAVDDNRTNRKPTVCLKEKYKTKDSKDSGFGQHAYDSETVESFFSQHFADNRRGDLRVIVNPTLERRINGSNSESRATFGLCRPPLTEFNCVSTEVVECLNVLIDKVCKNSEKNIEIDKNLNKNNILDNRQVEPDRTIHLEKVTYIIEEKKAKGKTKSTPVIKSKFKNTKRQKKVLKKNNKLVTKSLDKLPPIDEKQRDLSSKNRTRILPGKKSPTDEVIEIPLNKRKRKLYSKKDDNLINIKTGTYVSETEEDNSVLPGVNKSLISGATPYKELEKMRKIAAARHSRNRKSETETTTLFDLLKKTVESEEKIVLVDKKLIDKDALYNISSSSEDDEDFKRKKLVRRNKANSEKTKKTKRGPIKPQPNSNPKHDSNATVTHSKSKRKDKKLIPPEPVTNLVDERMRKATVEALNTSLIIESRKDESNVELEPAHKIPRMEIVPHEKEHEIVTVPAAKRKRTKHISQRLKERKNISKNKLGKTTDKDYDRKTISSLSSLEIETAQKTDDSILMLDKLENKYAGDKGIVDLTQNLLSEAEPVNTSRSKLNITDEFNGATSNIRYDSKKSNTVIGTERVRKARSSSYDSNTSKGKTLVVVLDRIDIHSLKSIPTVGTSPITAHGDIDESPPQVKEIDKTIVRRSLETENFSEGTLKFYNKLTNDVNVSTERHPKGTESAKKSQNVLETSYSNKDIREKSSFVFKSITERIPFVSISRLTQNELDRHLAPSRNRMSNSLTSRSKVSSQTPRERTNNKNTQRVRKSIISPISFRGMFGRRSLSPEEEQSRYLEISRPEKSQSSEEQQAHSSKTSEPEQFQSSSNRYNLRKFGKTYGAKDKSQSTRGSQVYPGLNKLVAKKQKFDVKNTSAGGETQPCGSSVEDWFCRNERSAPSTKEDAKNKVWSAVLQKVNTTLDEILLNTRSSMIKLQAQTKSEYERKEKKRKEEIRQLQSQAEQMKHTLAQMQQGLAQMQQGLAQVQQRLVQIDRTSQKEHEHFMQSFETRTLQVLNEDFSKNRTFMTLLNDDIEAAMKMTGNDHSDDE